MASTESFQDALKRAREVAANMSRGIQGVVGTIVAPPMITPPLKREGSNDDVEYGAPQPKRFQNEYGTSVPNPEHDPDRPQRNKLYLDGIFYQGEKFLDLLIPGNRVGIVIGKGGETIKSLQNEANVKMLVIQESTEAGSRDKQLRISGQPDRVDFARKLVEDLIKDKPDRQQPQQAQQFEQRKPPMQMNGGVNSGFPNNMPMGLRPNYFEYPVSPKMTGLVIGKQGETIRKIQAETGCRVQFDGTKTDSNGNKICQFTGNQDAITRALEMVKNICQANGNTDSIQEEMKLLVPAGRTGTVIGRGGETIKNLKITSGCNIELEKNYLNEHDEKCFIIRGPADKIQYAQQLVTEKAGGSTRVLSTTIKNNPYQETVLAHHLMQTGAHGALNANSMGYGLSNAAQGSADDMNAYYAAYYQQYYAQDPNAVAAAAAAAAGVSSGTAATASTGTGDASVVDNEAIMKQWIEYYNYHRMKNEAEAMEAQLREYQKSKTSSTNGSQRTANGHSDR